MVSDGVNRVELKKLHKNNEYSVDPVNQKAIEKIKKSLLNGYGLVDCYMFTWPYILHLFRKILIWVLYLPKVLKLNINCNLN